MRLTAPAVLALMLAAGCLGQQAPGEYKEVEQVGNMTLSSPAFKVGGSIPSRFTCDGVNVSPPLMISAVPQGARSLALVVDDPDAPAGDWVHWVVWNIRPETTEITEGTAPTGAVQGLTDFRQNNWGGPCPPSGTHRYFFSLYALDTTLNLPPSSGKADLLAALKGHMLAQSQLMGTYKRA
jgi:Raf kinase inhibitor-like YbhB/YbcL family protein